VLLLFGLDCQNRVRDDSRETLALLRAGDIRPVMVTGDGPITGIAVARECGLVRENARIVLGKVESGRIVWHDADTNEILEGLEQLLPDFSCLDANTRLDFSNRIKLVSSPIEALSGYRTLLDVNPSTSAKVDLGNFSEVDCNMARSGEHDRSISGRIELAMTGGAFCLLALSLKEHVNGFVSKSMACDSTEVHGAVRTSCESPGGAFSVRTVDIELCSLSTSKSSLVAAVEEHAGSCLRAASTEINVETPDRVADLGSRSDSRYGIGSSSEAARACVIDRNLAQRILLNTRIFARMLPHHKTQLMECFMGMGLVTVCTSTDLLQ
jgi:magnesium-transporting ATPase (P-type)